VFRYKSGVHNNIAINLNNQWMNGSFYRLVSDRCCPKPLVFLPTMMQRNRESCLKFLDQLSCFDTRTIIGNNNFIWQASLFQDSMQAKLKCRFPIVSAYNKASG